MRKLTFRTAGILGAALALATPSVAIAAQSSSYSPLVSLSMVASPQSATALCARALGEAGATAATEANGTATTTQEQPAGCVLPVADAAPVQLPPQAAAAPRAFTPLLLGLGAIGLGVLLFALLHGDNDEPPPQPVSPA